MRNAWRRGAGSAAVLVAIGVATCGSAQTRSKTAVTILPIDAPDIRDRAFPTTIVTPLGDLPLVRLTLDPKDQLTTRGWLRAQTRIRKARAVADFYPVAGSGLRLSAGTRMHSGYAQTAVAPDTRLALRVDPWRSRGPSSLGAGYQSYAPVAMAGYDQRLTEHWRLGVDAGAMRGRMASIYPFDGSAGRGSGPGAEGADRVNPVMDLTVAYAF